MRPIYRAIGFQKGYNFVLWFLFAGAFFGFILARSSYMDVNGNYRKNAAPGEWFWFRRGFYNAMLRLHLVTILPAGLLAILQFTPVIRHRVRLIHRINGYIIIVLFLASNVGAVGMSRRAFGGTIASQTFIGMLAIVTTASFGMALYNIKRLQIDQHRAWMLRVWFYLGCIITDRFIQPIVGIIVGQAGQYWAYYTVWSCQQIAFTDSQAVAGTYSACKADPNALTRVRANLAHPKNASEAGSALQLSFPAALWLAFMIHAVGVEIYLRLTPAESERLRQVSYERQVERGLEPADSAGLVAEKYGDAHPWLPHTEVKAKDGDEDIGLSSDGQSSEDCIARAEH